MKGEITFFRNQEFGVIRAVEIDGEPWFVGKDVAERLGYSVARKAIYDHVDEEDKRGFQIGTSSGAQEMTIINESGLYSLVLSSKLPRAKAFKRWVTSEVIPSIRKHGAYMTLETAEQMPNSRRKLHWKKQTGISQKCRSLFPEEWIYLQAIV